MRGPILGLMLATAVGGIGCSSQKPSKFRPVKGVVTYQGKPVENAVVSLVPKGGDGRSATGTTDSNGAFSAGTVGVGDGALPGEYSVTIIKAEAGESPYAHMTDMEEQQQAAKGPLPIPKPQHLLPQKYSKAATSGLSATIGDTGAEDLKFELVD